MMRFFIGPNNSTHFTEFNGDVEFLPGMVEVDKATYDAANDFRIAEMKAVSDALDTARRDQQNLDLASLISSGIPPGVAQRLVGLIEEED